MDKDVLNNYKLGINELDKQHEELFKKIDDMNCHEKNEIASLASSVIESDLTSEEYTELFKNFIKKTKQHFAFEENLMKDIGYPYLEYHIKNHLNIISKYEELFKPLEKTPSKFLKKYIVNQLNQIFLNHIDNADFQIVEFLKKKKT